MRAGVVNFYLTGSPLQRRVISLKEIRRGVCNENSGAPERAVHGQFISCDK